MAEPDLLFTVRNAFYLGAFQSAIAEASDLEGLSDQEKVERDCYVYRSYIELGSYEVRGAYPPAQNRSFTSPSFRRSVVRGIAAARCSDTSGTLRRSLNWLLRFRTADSQAPDARSRVGAAGDQRGLRVVRASFASCEAAGAVPGRQNRQGEGPRAVRSVLSVRLDTRERLGGLWPTPAPRVP